MTGPEESRSTEATLLYAELIELYQSHAMEAGVAILPEEKEPIMILAGYLRGGGTSWRVRIKDWPSKYEGVRVITIEVGKYVCRYVNDRFLEPFADKPCDDELLYDFRGWLQITEWDAVLSNTLAAYAASTAY